MKSLPVAITFTMLGNKQPIETKKFSHKEKSYKLSVYEVTKADFGKVKRIDGQATMRLGGVKENNQEFEINAKSISMDELRTIIAEFPLIGVLSVQRGTLSDTGEKRYVAVTSMAFADAAKSRQAMLAMLKIVVETKEQRDQQRTKLYKFEGVYFNKVAREDSGWKKTKLSKLKEIADKVITHFKIPKDKVHITTQGTKSASKLGVTHTYRDDVASKNPNFTVIHIHDGTPDTLIHELAHLVTHSRYTKGEVQGHGAEFCGVYAHILGLFTKFDEDEVIKAMTTYGLKVKKYTQSTTKVEEI